MGVHGKTIFDWPRNLEYQDIHFDTVESWFGSRIDWFDFLKKHTSMKRPSSITKDIIHESANILFEYEILDGDLQKPGSEYRYFINNAEVRIVHKSAESLQSLYLEAGDIFVGVFSGTLDDSFVKWIESDIQPRYRIWLSEDKNPRWSGETYDINELSAAFDFIILKRVVKDMKIGEERVIKVVDDNEELIKRVI